MIGWLVVFCHLLALSCGGIIQPSCSAVNDVFDSALNKSNTQMNESTSGVEPEDIIHLTLPVHVFGIRLPWTVSVELSDGLMEHFASLSRSSDFDAIECVFPITRTLQAQLKYDNIIFSFKTMKAKFLYFQMDGSLMYNVGPTKFDIAIAEGTTLGPPQGPTCSIEAYQLVSSGTKDVEITSKSWATWFFKKLMMNSLLDENTVPVVGLLVQTSIGNLFTYFGQDWCEYIWKDNDV